MEKDNTLTNNTIEFIKYQCDRYAQASVQAMEVANIAAEQHGWTHERKIQCAIKLIDEYLGENHE